MIILLKLLSSSEDYVTARFRATRIIISHGTGAGKEFKVHGNQDFRL
jgi:hypothetical protein